MSLGLRPQSPESIVSTCAPDEFHKGSLLMVGDLLSRQAWQITYMGLNVPLVDLVSYVQKYAPRAVVSVAMQKESAEAFSEWPKYIPPDIGKLFMMFGGKAFIDDPKLQKIPQGYTLGMIFKQVLTD